MQGVVLAAGEGTRMRPLTSDRPKGLVEVAGRPLLSHCFDVLRDAGVDELVVVVGYRAGDVVSRYGETYDGTPITYVHQRERRGLAHALELAAPHVDRDFLSMNGDNVCRANLDDLVELHRETGADATALVEETTRERARKGAVFELDDGEVVGAVEKPAEPPSTLVPRGVYAFSPVIFDACRLVEPSERGEYELTDAVAVLLAARRRVETVPLEGWCINVNEPGDRKRVESQLDGQAESE